MSESIRKNNEIMEAISAFNLKIKSGLEAFARLGHKDAKSLAKFFLKYNSKFAKDKLGEFLTDEEEFPKETFKEFCQLFNFKGMFMPDAFRYILTFTEVPGEGQKIERFCMPFGEKYYNDNPDVMHLDQTGTYAFLMIQTHTFYQKFGMDSEYTSMKFFCSQADALVAYGPLIPKEYNEAVYQNLVAKPLAVHWSQLRKEFAKEAALANAKKKEDLSKVENKKIMEELKASIESLKDKQEKDREMALANKQVAAQPQEYIAFTNVNLVRPFLSSIWKELFAFFTIIIENSTEEVVYADLVTYAIRMMKLGDLFNMDEERDAFIQVFIQFSGLDWVENKDLTPKNLFFIRVLSDLATQHKHHLHKGWRIVLNILLKLDYLTFIASGADKKDRSELKDKTKVKPKKDIELLNAQLIGTSITTGMLGRVLMSSQSLDQRSISDFCESLALVAKDKLQMKDFQNVLIRTFELIDVNSACRKFSDLMEIFDTLTNEFIEIIVLAESKRPDQHPYCIDSLKNLITTFLSKPNSSEGSNQQRILLPWLKLAQSTALANFRKQM